MNKNIVFFIAAITFPLHAEKEAAPQKQEVVVSLPELSKVWENCKEYILSPIVINIVNKKVTDMKVGELSAMLENKIQTIMAEFINLGNQAKQLSSDKANKDAIQKIHAQMAELFHQLRPAETTVRGMYPKMIKLFDQINKLYPDQYTQLDYVIDETMFNTIQEAVTEKEKSRWLWN